MFSFESDDYVANNINSNIQTLRQRSRKKTQKQSETYHNIFIVALFYTVKENFIPKKRASIKRTFSKFNRCITEWKNEKVKRIDCDSVQNILKIHATCNAYMWFWSLLSCSKFRCAILSPYSFDIIRFRRICKFPSFFVRLSSPFRSLRFSSTNGTLIHQIYNMCYKHVRSINFMFDFKIENGRREHQILFWNSTLLYSRNKIMFMRSRVHFFPYECMSFRWLVRCDSFFGTHTHTLFSQRHSTTKHIWDHES